MVADIGSGIGNVGMQCAATCGAKNVILVELCQDRDFCARQLESMIADAAAELVFPLGRRELHRSTFTQENADGRAINARLAAESDVLIVNNAEDTFGHRAAVKSGNLTPNQHLASLARRLKVGARLVTLNAVDIANLGHANDWMTRTDRRSGPAAVSWSDSPVDYYVYQKVKNEWTCPKCTLDNPLTDAAGEDVTTCAMCVGQGTEVRAKRQRRAKTKDDKAA